MVQLNISSQLFIGIGANNDKLLSGHHELSCHHQLSCCHQQLSSWNHQFSSRHHLDFWNCNFAKYPLSERLSFECWMQYSKCIACTPMISPHNENKSLVRPVGEWCTVGIFNPRTISCFVWFIALKNMFFFVNLMHYKCLNFKINLLNGFLIPEQAFREFLVSLALISNLNGHKSVALSHVKCKILTYFIMSFICSL